MNVKSAQLLHFNTHLLEEIFYQIGVLVVEGNDNFAFLNCGKQVAKNFGEIDCIVAVVNKELRQKVPYPKRMLLLASQVSFIMDLEFFTQVSDSDSALYFSYLMRLIFSFSTIEIRDRTEWTSG